MAVTKEIDCGGDRWVRCTVITCVHSDGEQECCVRIAVGGGAVTRKRRKRGDSV